MNSPSRQLTPDQLRTSMICFNKEVRIVEETPYHCRLRIRLNHSGMAKLYGKLFPLRDYHDYILDGLGLAFFQTFRDHPVAMKDIVKQFQNGHKLSYFEALTLTRNYVGRLMRCGIVVIEIGK